MAKTTKSRIKLLVNEFKQLVIKKAALPVEGFGTRFLSVCKSILKEMVTVDRLAIECVVKEAVGIVRIILVTYASKASIENYFDCTFELEIKLGQKKKFDLLKSITKTLPQHVSVCQPEPLGLGLRFYVPKLL